MSLEFLNSVLSLISGILLASWEIFVEAAPYLVFGFGIAGLLNVLVPDRKIVDYLGASAGKVRSVVNASLAGLPLPLCSCGVIPAAMSIRKRGANRGATLSFLISTPETGVDSIAVTYALLDPLMAVFRPFVALMTAILAGLADNFLIGEETGKENIKKQENPGKKAEILAVSTLIGASVQGNHCNPYPCSSSSCNCNKPADLVNGKTGHVTTLVKDIELKLSGVKYLGISNKPEGIRNLTLVSPDFQKDSPSCGCGGCECEEEPVTEGKIEKSIRARLIKGIKYAYIELPGEISRWMFIGIVFAGIISYAVPVFLLAGPATNAATITMVARFLGKRSAALYLGVISLCALGAGFVLDWFYLKLGISAAATVGTAKELLPEDMKLGFAFLLLPLMLYGAFRSEKECGCSERH